MNPKFEFTADLKKSLFWMMGIGVLGLALAFLFYGENQHARFWTNILANTYYFTGIGLFGLFAVAAGTLAYGSWHILVKRIFLSLSAFTRIGGFLLLGILLLGIFGVHNLYDHVMHILHTGSNAPSSIHTTKLIYFAPWFWISRVAVYAVLWYLFSVGMNNFFARTDQTDPKVYKRSKLISAAFIVIFALTESAVSWDMIMSLDPHWYSTLFGWYNFASYGCAAWAMTILIVIFLKSKGYLEVVNENHVHDLGKLLFGFSIFWTYLWFDQFMLQWYANMPEETSFWIKRFDVGYFKFTVFTALIINFLFPLFFLIKRGAKRSFRMIGFGAALLIFGHYVDFFNYTFVEANWNTAAQHQHEEAGAEHGKHAAAKPETVVLYAANEEHKATTTDVTPVAENKEEVATEVKHEEEHGAVAEHGAAEHGKTEHGTGEHGGAEAGAKHGHEAAPEANFAGIGPFEVMIFIGFLGAFLYLFFNNLSKRPIVPENDPYLKESEKIVVIYS